MINPQYMPFITNEEELILAVRELAEQPEYAQDKRPNPSFFSDVCSLAFLARMEKSVLFVRNLAYTISPSETVDRLEVALGRSKQQKTKQKDFDTLASKIVGQSEAKARIKEAIDTKLDLEGRAATLGINAPNGILLCGPPGTGKTMLARLAAEYMGSESGFFSGNGLASRWIGESEQTVRDLFTKARQYYKKTDTRAVLFIDEADDVLAVRTKHNGSGQWGPGHMTGTWLAEMDPRSEDDKRYNPFIILASNAVESIDPAVLRPGRIDVTINVGQPTINDARAFVQLYIPPTAGNIGTIADNVVTALTNEPIFPVRAYVFDALKTNAGTDEQFDQAALIEDPTLASELSGAMLAGLCAEIKRQAFNDQGATAIDTKHVTAAIGVMLEQARQRGFAHYLNKAREAAGKAALELKLQTISNTKQQRVVGLN